MRLFISLLVVLSICAFRPVQLVSQQDHLKLYLDTSEFRVEPAPEWTQLFHRTSGWFGADGVFSIGLDGNDANDGEEETLILFGDTFIGEVVDGAPAPGHVMVNNTVAYMKGCKPDAAQIDFRYKTDAEGHPQSFFIPDNPSSQPGQHFWLGDGFVNKEKDNTLYIFAYHIQWTGENVFDFIEPDVSLLAIPAGSRPPFDMQRQIPTPLHVDHDALGQGNFGAGIFVNTAWAGAPHPDGYVYVYACIGPAKNLVVARVEPASFEDFDKWRYWDGTAWQADEARLASIADGVSNELSVTPLDDGRVLLTFQVLGISDKVGIRIGRGPAGPFGEIQEIWRTPEFDEGLWPYNAKAHPALSRPGELLISYNTITPDFWNDIEKDAHIYRPRFIRLVWK